MEKRRTRRIVAGVLLTHVVLMVFALGFTGCDLIKSILGMEEDDPNPPSPEDPVYLRLYVGVPAESSEATDDEEEPDGTKENPLPTIQEALRVVAEAYTPTSSDTEGGEGAQAPAEVKPWPGKGTPAKEKSAEIVLLSPVTVDAKEEMITIPAPAGTTYPPLILSADNSVKLENEDEGHITLSENASQLKNVSLLTVGTGVTLTLRNITLKGIGSNNYCSSLVKVGSGGNLILADKAVIRGHDSSYGGGVYVVGGGTFTMSGGEIRDNHASWGGGVYVANNGMFIMSDGKIGDNYATYGGGVSVADGGTFTMSGGEIWGNEAKVGGGVYVQDGDGGGTFTMSGGKIGDNSAGSFGGGVYVQGDGGGVRFAKTGGSVIYGKNENDDVDDNSNKLSDSDGSGDAICVVTADEFGLDEVVKKRDRTVGVGVDLYWPLTSIPDGAANNWDPQP